VHAQNAIEKTAQAARRHSQKANLADQSLGVPTPELMEDDLTSQNSEV
jgi:hypothetical protein